MEESDSATPIVKEEALDPQEDNVDFADGGHGPELEDTDVKVEHVKDEPREDGENSR